MKYLPFICSFVLIISSCSTSPVYKPVVDPNSITDKNYTEDYELCEKATDQIDYSNEENQAAMRGGLAGLGVVGAGAGIVAATGGLVLAAWALPIAAIGTGIGAIANKGQTDKEEQELRAIVFNKCLENRGYEVLSKK